jgi:hypothetical protein
MTSRQRFLAARAGEAYRSAMLRPVASGDSAAKTVGLWLLFGVPYLGVGVARLVMYGAPAFLVILGLFVAIAAATALIARRGPITRQLAIVDPRWAPTASADPLAVQLRFEDCFREHRATPRARRQAGVGSIGVAFFRRDMLVGFERLDE